MSIISLIDALRMQKKFYIAASEYPLPCVLCAMKKRRLASGRRRDFMLAEIDPPIPASTFAGIAPAVTNDVRQLILAARFEGTSLFPIQEWPCYVHVLVPCFNTDGVRKFEMKDAYHWIWAELYRTKEDAEKAIKEYEAIYSHVGCHIRSQMEWRTVYDLSKDSSSVMQVQKATLETEDYGLLPDIALFGSLEWWNAVRDGRIPTHTTSGVITKVTENVRGTWPLCEINSGGVKTEWTRYGEDDAYQVGRRICIEYVYQRGKPSKVWKGLSGRMKVVLRVSIEC